MAAAIGRTLGSYRVLGLLGEGGMGLVYLAEHPLLGSRAVVKQLHPQLSSDREAVERFFNEAVAATRIKHRGIVSVFDFGYAQDGAAFIAMEFLDGECLGARIQRLGRIPELDAIRVARQIASALSAAHQAGIIHRDLKPDNVFIVPDEEVTGGERAKILDFGIAKLGSDQGTLSKTRTGAIMGSPLYMSPEQCRGGGAVDARADIYSLGCVLYEMLCGRPPFLGQGVGEIIAKHIYEAPVPPGQIAPVSPGLERAVLKALAKEPADRHASMRAMLLELSELDPSREHTPLPLASHMPRAPSQAGVAPTVVATAARASRPRVAERALGQPGQADPQWVDARRYANGPLPTGPSLARDDSQLMPATSRRGMLVALAAIILVGAAGLAVLFGRADKGAAAVEVPAVQPAATAPAAGPARDTAPIETSTIGTTEVESNDPARAVADAGVQADETIPEPVPASPPPRASRRPRRPEPPIKKERKWGETVDALAEP